MTTITIPERDMLIHLIIRGEAPVPPAVVEATPEGDPNLYGAAMAVALAWGTNPEVIRLLSDDALTFHPGHRLLGLLVRMATEGQDNPRLIGQWAENLKSDAMGDAIRATLLVAA